VKDRESHFRVILGCIAISAYLTLFSAGLLIDSEPYRRRLAEAPVASPALAAVETASAVPANLAPVSAPAPSLREWSREDLVAAVAAILLYTPTNVAFLTLLAGFVGGCASYVTFVQAKPRAEGDPEQVGPAGPNREAFRTESPFASMFRSFLVYLAFITGIFITAGNPFERATAEQYVRFAGTLSLFGFVVGYDPAKFQDFLNFVPRREK
jgi:hypothetical protein